MSDTENRTHVDTVSSSAEEDTWDYTQIQIKQQQVGRLHLCNAIGQQRTNKIPNWQRIAGNTNTQRLFNNVPELKKMNTN